MSPSVVGALQAIASSDERDEAFSKTISVETALGQQGDGTRFYSITGPLGDTLVPAAADVLYKVVTYLVDPTGLVEVGEGEVKRCSR